jgi:hypothetical protein
MLFKFLLAKIQQYDFYDKTWFFIFRPFFLFPEQFSELNSFKSLCKSVFWLIPAPLVIPSCTVTEPTAEFIHLCASALPSTACDTKPC